MATVEQLSTRRRLLLMGLASTFLIWQVPTMDAVSEFARGNRGVLEGVSLMGGLAWSVLLLFLLMTWKPWRADRATRDALEDELVKANRRTAFLIGYVLTALTAAGFYVLTLFVEARGAEVAHVIVTVAVVTPLYAFAFIEARNA